MNYELPEGCNILSSPNTIQNYTNNDRKRTTYTIQDGKLYKSSESDNQYGFTHTGACLVTGDIEYKPELTVYFHTMATVIFCGIILFTIKILRGRG